jgi:hypothetical protein
MAFEGTNTGAGPAAACCCCCCLLLLLLRVPLPSCCCSCCPFSQSKSSNQPANQETKPQTTNKPNQTKPTVEDLLALVRRSESSPALESSLREVLNMGKDGAKWKNFTRFLQQKVSKGGHELP